MISTNCVPRINFSIEMWLVRYLNSTCRPLLLILDIGPGLSIFAAVKKRQKVYSVDFKKVAG